MTTKESIKNRLMTMIRKGTEVTSDRVSTPCWVYTGWVDDNGYGRFSLPRAGYTTTGKTRRRHLYVHRIVYTLFVGPIPKNYDIDHLCYNRRCCRPSHLEAVTHEENIRRRDEYARNNPNLSSGRHGIPYGDERPVVARQRPKDFDLDNLA